MGFDESQAHKVIRGEHSLAGQWQVLPNQRWV